MKTTIKLLGTILLLLILLGGRGQTNAATIGANSLVLPNTTMATTGGIGEIKVGMTVANLEKLTGKAVKLKNLLDKDGDNDTVDVVYNELPMQVVLGKWYMEDDKMKTVVLEVKTSSPMVKTRSGIGMGDDKLKIISTYEGYRIHIMPEYDKDYTTKIKNKSTIWLHDDENGKVIVFYLTNNRVTAINVTYQEGC